MSSSRSLAGPPASVAAASAGLSQAAFARLAWGSLAYLLLVVLFGAWVRITGSGAGCGSDWPECQGRVIPREATAELVIEYTHRITSALSGLVVLVVLGWAWRSQPPRVRRAALASALLMLVEALLGAVLVRAELVGNDASLARAVVISLHLCNTLALAASLGLVAWWSGSPWGARADEVGQGQRLDSALGLATHGQAVTRQPSSGKAAAFGWLDVRMAALLVVGVSIAGAVTALGDTVFPPGALHTKEHARHFLVQLRVVHPVLAIVGGLGILKFARVVRRVARKQSAPWQLAAVLEGALWVQLGLGGLNVALRAPGWLQIAHLLGAYGVWLSLVFLYAELSPVTAQRRPLRQPA